MSLDFYKNLKPFKNFNEFYNSTHYTNVPPDWNLIITDIKGSTDFIQRGLYRDVNTLGVASIIVIRRELDRQDFPFIFGGDGATILLPNQETEQVVPYLLGLKKIAIQNFSMELRIGIIKLQEILTYGKNIEIARFQLSKGFSQAMLRGTGVSYGERLIKDNYDTYKAKSIIVKEPDLTGLTCRWKPIPSQKGQILTLIISPRIDHEDVYQELLLEFNKIFPNGIELLNPALYDRNSYRPAWESFQNENKLKNNNFLLNQFYHYIRLVFASISFNFRLPFPRLINYIRSTASHTDFRKFDDTLRMVIDCSKDEASRIIHFLEVLYSKNKIYYGSHLSKNSLMTCYVEGMSEGQHIHFLDAENGGYTQAAIQFKSQLKK